MPPIPLLALLLAAANNSAFLPAPGSRNDSAGSKTQRGITAEVQRTESDSLSIRGPRRGRVGIDASIRRRSFEPAAPSAASPNKGLVVLGALAGAVAVVFLSVSCEGCMAIDLRLVAAGALLGALLMALVS